MDYITKFYKNRAEDLYEQVIALENKLKMMTEAMTGSYPSQYTVSARTPTARKNYKGDAQQEFAARSGEAGGKYQVDSSGYLQSTYNSNSTQGQVPTRQSAAPLPTDMVSRAFSVPGSVAPMNVNPASLGGQEGTRMSAVNVAQDTPQARKNLEQQAMGTGQYQADVAAERAAGAASLAASAPAPKPAPAPTPAQQAATSPAAAPAWIPNSLFAVPPSAAQYAPTSTSVAAPRNPAIGAAVKPGEVSIDPNRNAVQNQVLPVAKAPLATPAAKVIIPQNSVVPGFQKPNKPKPEVSPKPAQAAPQGEDFSKFWAGKPRYGDLELQNMMRTAKRTNAFGPPIPDEKQPIEYRAAKAELIRRGKLKA